jgi:protein-tyrosine phosphatase
MNAATLVSPWGRRRALSLIREGTVSLVASDCHGVRHRPPLLDRARAVIGRRLGEEQLSYMDNFARSLLCGAGINSNGGNRAAERGLL